MMITPKSPIDENNADKPLDGRKRRVKSVEELIGSAFENLAKADEEAERIRDEIERLEKELKYKCLDIALHKVEILEWLASNSNDIDFNQKVIQLIRRGRFEEAVKLLRFAHT